MEAVASATRAPVRLSDCEGERCVADHQLRSAGLRLGTRPVPALGLWVEATAEQGQIRTAGFTGWGPQAGAGLSLTLPERSVRPALGAELLWAQLNDPDAAATSALRRLEAEVSLDLVVGEVEGEAAAWLGLTAWPLSRYAVTLEEEGLDLSLSRRSPVGLQLGGELYSSELGAPWSARPPRMNVGVELQALSAWGVGLRVGASY